jgi:hypothetical protein
MLANVAPRGPGVLACQAAAGSIPVVPTGTSSSSGAISVKSAAALDGSGARQHGPDGPSFHAMVKPALTAQWVEGGRNCLQRLGSQA